MSLMTFTSSMLGEAVRIRLAVSQFVDSGEFDYFIERLLAEIGRHDAPRVILELSEVQYFASAMLGLLVNVRQRVRSLGGRLVLAATPKRLLDTILTTSMDRLFTFANSVDDARRILESR